MTDTQITAVEAAIAAFAPDADIQSAVMDLERSCREYRTLLRQQDPDAGNRQLAQLQRINSQAYDKVMATIPVAQRAAVTAYIAANAGQPLPTPVKIISVSAARQVTNPPIKVK